MSRGKSRSKAGFRFFNRRQVFYALVYIGVGRLVTAVSLLRNRSYLSNALPSASIASFAIARNAPGTTNNLSLSLATMAKSASTCFRDFGCGCVRSCSSGLSCCCCRSPVVSAAESAVDAVLLLLLLFLLLLLLLLLFLLLFLPLLLPHVVLVAAVGGLLSDIARSSKPTLPVKKKKFGKIMFLYCLLSFFDVPKWLMNQHKLQHRSPQTKKMPETRKKRCRRREKEKKNVHLAKVLRPCTSPPEASSKIPLRLKPPPVAVPASSGLRPLPGPAPAAVCPRASVEHRTAACSSKALTSKQKPSDPRCDRRVVF